MTAQRTSLITLCLLAITVSLNVNDGSCISLFGTGIDVPKANASIMLFLLILIQGISYVWRFRADRKVFSPAYCHEEFERIETLKFREEELTNSFVEANEKVESALIAMHQKTEDRTAGTHRIQGVLVDGAAFSALHELVQNAVAIKTTMEKYIDHLNDNITVVLKRHKSADRREKWFDLWFPVILVVGAEILLFLEVTSGLLPSSACPVT